MKSRARKILGRKRALGWVCSVLGLILLTLALSACAYLFYLRQLSHLAPSPNQVFAELGEGIKDTASASSLWPEVDWDYWLELNPSLIGWISIPSSSISYPILQAPLNDPDYYLSHDVSGNLSPYGAIYLDASCATGGLFNSANAVVYGHHLNDGSMFAPLLNYRESSWAEEHKRVLFQTPDTRRIYYVRCVGISNNLEGPKYTSFASVQEQQEWYKQRLAEAEVVLDASTIPEHTISLVTCSYGTYEDERLVVILSP